MSKRLNIILPDSTARLLDRVAAKGDRSRLISEAVVHYVRSRSAANIRKRLKQGALAHADLNLEIAEEWFPAEKEAWQKLDRREDVANKPSRVVAKSTSRVKKTRPALVIQNDVTNRYGMTTIVAAITSRVSTPPYPNEVVLEPTTTSLNVVSTVRLDQIRTVDRKRLLKRVGKIKATEMKKVDEAILISLGLLSI